MANSLFKMLYGLYYANIPTMVWGDPGCGKSATVKFLGEILNVPVELRSGNKSDPTDFSGIPYTADIVEVGPDGNKVLNQVTGEYRKTGEKVIMHSEPAYIKGLKGAKNAILFFDELTTCPPPIQAALLSIIQDCKYGDFSIPETIYRVAAGNYNTIVGTHNVSLALMNRFCHIFVRPNAEAFAHGIVSGWSNYEKPIINTKEERVNKLLKYKLAVAEFTTQHPQALENMPEEMVKPTDVAYGSQRTWDLIPNMLAVLDQNDPEYLSELVCGTVGQTFGEMFLTFLDAYEGLGVDLPSFVGNEKAFRLPHPDRHDHVYQIMDSMQYYLKTDTNRYALLYAYVCRTLINEGKEYGDYTGYTNFVMTYLRNTLALIVNSGAVAGKGLQEYVSIIPGFQELLKLVTDKEASSVTR